MAVVKKKKAGGAGAANMGGLGITGDINSSILQQVQQSLQGIQNNPTGGYTGGTTPPYQQPPGFTGGPVYPSWGPGPMPRPPLQPITGPGMRGIPPVGSGFGGPKTNPIWNGPVDPTPRLVSGVEPPPQQPQPQMDWGGLMGKLQGILSPYLSGGGTGPGTGGAPVGGGTQNPMQSVMGALMGSLGGFMNQMPSGAQSGGMDWQNLAKQIQNPTQGASGTQGQLMNDIMGLMSGFSAGGQQQPPYQPPTGGVMPYSLAG